MRLFLDSLPAPQLCKNFFQVHPSKSLAKGTLLKDEAKFSHLYPVQGFTAIPKSVLCVGSEDSQELIRDGITMAAKMIDRVEQQGKRGEVHSRQALSSCGTSAPQFGHISGGMNQF